MAKGVSYSRDALKTLQRMDRTTAMRIRAKVDQLAADPSSLANNVKTLKGDDTGGPMMRLRVGDWRVIYRDGLVIAVIKIGPRGKVYD